MKEENTDKVFWDRFNAGDYNAFKQLFRTWYRDMAYFAAKLLQDPEAAKDVVQDVFIRLWESHYQFENTIALKSWLYLAVRNNCLNALKHNRVISDYEARNIQPEGEEHTWNTIIESEVISMLSGYLQQLPPECRKIMEYSLQGYNSNEIASLTGLSASTVRTQKQRGISLLKKILPREMQTLLMIMIRND